MLWKKTMMLFLCVGKNISRNCNNAEWTVHLLHTLFVSFWEVKNNRAWRKWCDFLEEIDTRTLFGSQQLRETFIIINLFRKNQFVYHDPCCSYLTLFTYDFLRFLFLWTVPKQFEINGDISILSSYFYHLISLFSYYVISNFSVF